MAMVMCIPYVRRHDYRHLSRRTGDEHAARERASVDDAGNTSCREPCIELFPHNVFL